jgi:hypothetical protein
MGDESKNADTPRTQHEEPAPPTGPGGPAPYKSLKGIFKGQLKITDAEIRAVRKVMWNPKRLKEKFDL